jgi:hypothetical protein
MVSQSVRAAAAAHYEANDYYVPVGIRLTVATKEDLGFVGVRLFLSISAVTAEIPPVIFAELLRTSLVFIAERHPLRHKMRLYGWRRDCLVHHDCFWELEE